MANDIMVNGFAARLPARLHTVLTESLQLMQTTTNPEVFFGRYQEALFAADGVLKTGGTKTAVSEAAAAARRLVEERELLIRDFVERCAKKGLLGVHKDAILSRKDLFSAELADEIRAHCAEQSLPASAEMRYRYCAVALDKSGRTYYYRTEDPSVRCADEVIVPVGEEGDLAIGTVERIEICSEATAPYPPHLTKLVLAKARP